MFKSLFLYIFFYRISYYSRTEVGAFNKMIRLLFASSLPKAPSEDQNHPHGPSEC